MQQARLQLTNGERQVAGAANATKPEIDLYGTYESRGVVIPGLTAIGGDSLTGNALTDPIPTGGNRSSTVYEAGVQFFLPVQNRVAEANLGADKALLRQQQLRVTQLESQVAAEVQNAIQPSTPQKVRPMPPQKRESCRRSFLPRLRKASRQVTQPTSRSLNSRLISLRRKPPR